MTRGPLSVHWALAEQNREKMQTSSANLPQQQQMTYESPGEQSQEQPRKADS